MVRDRQYSQLTIYLYHLSYRDFSDSKKNFIKIDIGWSFLLGLWTGFWFMILRKSPQNHSYTQSTTETGKEGIKQLNTPQRTTSSSDPSEQSRWVSHRK